jgi:hypothetical protein
LSKPSIPTLVLLASFAALPASAEPKPDRFTMRQGPLVRRVTVRKKEPACAGMERLPHRTENPFKPGEELAYELSVGAAFVGRLEMKIGEPRQAQGKTVIPLFGRARTNGFVSTFEPFEGRYMSLVDPVTLVPIGVRVESTYGGDPRWEKIRFHEDHRKVTADFLLQGQELSRTYAGEHDLTDILTMVYAARRVNLTVGMQGCQDVFGARRLWRMAARVDRVVEIDTIAGKRSAYEVKTSFARLPTPGLDNRNPPKVEIDVFLSKDESQAPLSFAIRQGPITADAKLVRWSLSGTPSKDEGWSF